MHRDGGLGLVELLSYLVFLERICLKIVKFQGFYCKLIYFYGSLLLSFSIMTIFHVMNAIYSIMLPILSLFSSKNLIHSSLFVLFLVLLIYLDRTSLFPIIHLIVSSQMFSLWVIYFVLLFFRMEDYLLMILLLHFVHQSQSVSYLFVFVNSLCLGILIKHIHQLVPADPLWRPFS